VVIGYIIQLRVMRAAWRLQDALDSEHARLDESELLILSNKWKMRGESIIKQSDSDRVKELKQEFVRHRQSLARKRRLLIWFVFLAISLSIIVTTFRKP
jgi:hypothetical protein